MLVYKGSLQACYWFYAPVPHSCILFLLGIYSAQPIIFPPKTSHYLNISLFLQKQILQSGQNPAGNFNLVEKSVVFICSECAPSRQAGRKPDGEAHACHLPTLFLLVLIFDFPSTALAWSSSCLSEHTSSVYTASCSIT